MFKLFKKKNLSPGKQWIIKTLLNQDVRFDSVRYESYRKRGVQITIRLLSDHRDIPMFEGNME